DADAGARVIAEAAILTGCLRLQRSSSGSRLRDSLTLDFAYTLIQRRNNPGFRRKVRWIIYFDHRTFLIVIPSLSASSRDFSFPFLKQILVAHRRNPNKMLK